MNEILTINSKTEERFLRKKTPTFDINELKDKKKEKEMRELIKKMRDIMKKANGVGLSANQIGLSHRLFVAQVYDSQGKQKFYAIFNPEIVKQSEEVESIEEGCLSVPQKYGPVTRAYALTLTGFDQKGKKLKIKAWGLLARVFQHEVDHLNGKLFIDKATRIYDITDEPKTQI
jgi:peptide deformylase